MPKKQLKHSMLMLTVAIFAILVFGTIIFSYLENWNIIDAFYFVTMTATTVGYGDFAPTNTISKIFTIIYSITIIPFILYAFSALAKYHVEKVYRKISGIQKVQKEQDEELDKTERQIRYNKKLIKNQMDELEKQEKILIKQAQINRKQQKYIKEQNEELGNQHKKLQKAVKELKEHDEELESHQKEIKKTKKELKEHDLELDVVEDVVEEQIIKKLK